MASMRVTLLLVLVLGLAVQGFARKGKDHDRHRRRSHWERSKYCPEDRVGSVPSIVTVVECSLAPAACTGLQ